MSSPPSNGGIGEIKLGQTRVKKKKKTKYNAAINSMEGKVAKIVRVACAGARVHACFRPPRRVYEQRERGGRGGKGPYRPRVDLRGAPCIFTAAL